MSANKITTALDLIGETLRCTVQGTIRGFSFELRITKDDPDARAVREINGLFGKEQS